MTPGHWTFQLVEEYDDGYYAEFRAVEKAARDELAGGRRHLYEAELKEHRRTHGRAGHEARDRDRLRGAGRRGHDGPGYSTGSGRRRWASSARMTVATSMATTTANSHEASSMSLAASGAWKAASRKPSQAKRR